MWFGSSDQSTESRGGKSTASKNLKGLQCYEPNSYLESRDEGDDGEDYEEDQVYSATSSSSLHRGLKPSRSASRLVTSTPVQAETRERDDDALAKEEEAIYQIVKQDMYSDQKKMVKKAVLILREKCRNPNDRYFFEKCKLLHDLGAHIAILEVLDKYASSASIAIAGTQCLANICFLTDCRKSVGDSGAVKTIVNLMGRHKKNEDYQFAAIAALGNLVNGCYHNAFRVVIDRQQLGISSIVRAMAAFPKNVMLQGYACQTIYNLCKWDKFIVEVRQNYGASATARAYENHPDDEQIGKYGPIALAIMIPPTRRA